VFFWRRGRHRTAGGGELGPRALRGPHASRSGGKTAALNSPFLGWIGQPSRGKIGGVVGFRTFCARAHDGSAPLGLYSWLRLGDSPPPRVSQRRAGAFFPPVPFKLAPTRGGNLISILATFVERKARDYGMAAHRRRLLSPSLFRGPQSKGGVWNRRALTKWPAGRPGRKGSWVGQTKKNAVSTWRGGTPTKQPSCSRSVHHGDGDEPGFFHAAGKPDRGATESGSVFCWFKWTAANRRAGAGGRSRAYSRPFTGGAAPGEGKNARALRGREERGRGREGREPRLRFVFLAAGPAAPEPTGGKRGGGRGLHFQRGVSGWWGELGNRVFFVLRRNFVGIPSPGPRKTTTTSTSFKGARARGGARAPSVYPRERSTSDSRGAAPLRGTRAHPSRMATIAAHDCFGTQGVCSAHRRKAPDAVPPPRRGRECIRFRPGVLVFFFLLLRAAPPGREEGGGTVFCVSLGKEGQEGPFFPTHRSIALEDVILADRGAGHAWLDCPVFCEYRGRHPGFLWRGGGGRPSRKEARVGGCAGPPLANPGRRRGRDRPFARPPCARR